MGASESNAKVALQRRSARFSDWCKLEIMARFVGLIGEPFLGGLLVFEVGKTLTPT